MPQVKVKISVDGELSMDFMGFMGNDCHLKEARLKEIIKELELTKVSETKKMVTDDRMELEKA